MTFKQIISDCYYRKRAHDFKCLKGTLVVISLEGSVTAFYLIFKNLRGGSYPFPLQPELCSTSLMGVWYSLNLYCTGLCIHQRIFFLLFLITACEMPGFRNASILLARKQFLGRKLSGLYISYAVTTSSPQDLKHVYSSANLWTLSLRLTSSDCKLVQYFPC